MKQIAYLAVCLLLFTLDATYAASSNIQVEMIVFQHQKTQRSDNEIFPNQLYRFNAPKALELPSGSKNADQIKKHAYQELPSQFWILQQVHKQLAKNADYRILLHKAWVQPLSQHTQAVMVKGGEPFDHYGNKIDNVNKAGADKAEPAYWSVKGKVRITRHHTLAAHIRLNVTQNIDQLPAELVARLQPSPGKHDLISFDFDQMRHIKYNEINYLDHPVFGVLLMIKQRKDT